MPPWLHSILFEFIFRSEIDLTFYSNMADQSIEMDRIDPGDKIKNIEIAVEKNRIDNFKNLGKTKKYGRINTAMLALLILCFGLIIGVLSGYIIRLPHHEQTSESDASKLGTHGVIILHIEIANPGSGSPGPPGALIRGWGWAEGFLL